MGTPDSREHQLDAMNDWGGVIVQSLVRGRFDPKTTKILDVGAGWGKYRKLLPEYYMDACEVWEPYVKENKLEKLYDRVFISDICDLIVGNYDAIIMGDVFEHIDKEDAYQLLERLKEHCTEVFIVVPYSYPQGEVDGNPYEVHLQPDLTMFEMAVRYPQLELIIDDDESQKGLYCWKQ
jgi:2-polyprenyl-3-methyl-5-hydroxy-6-metoxy-1,4-benzoquinol methylase